MRLLKDSELWEDDCLILEASKSFGKEIVIKTLEQESLTNNNIKAYLGFAE